MIAAQAMAAARSHWQLPSVRGPGGARRATTAPTLLPMPNPTRNTARIKEKL